MGIAGFAGGGLNALANDIGNLAGAIAEADIATDDMVLIAHPETANKIRLLAPAGFSNTVLENRQIAVATVIAVSPAGVFSAYSGVPKIEVSGTPTISIEDTTPLPISSGTQGSGILAVPTKSAYQHDLLVIKVTCRVAWAALPGAVQWVQLGHVVTPMPLREELLESLPRTPLSRRECR